MKLTKVEINNFRSIENLSLNFSPNCQILVGINESGKSNLLRALSLLSPDLDPTLEDIREPLTHESSIKESYVRFVFSLNKEERESLIDEALKLILCQEFEAPLYKQANNEISLMDYFLTLDGGTYRIDVKDQSKSARYWSITSNHKLNKNWKKPSSNTPSNYTVVLKNGSAVNLDDFNLINIEDVDSGEIPDEYLEATDLKHIHSEIVGPLIIKLVNASLPECVFWRYNETNLLPGKIELEGFKSAPESCLPLKHMFELAGVENITDKISEVALRTNGLPNLLRRVSEKATEHLKEIWKDYKNIKIHLSLNGPHIDATIQDKFNFFDLTKRSDGFKRFITFLLMVSAKERTNTLSNTILLIDEPDASLHPSSARYLRDELIKISKSNTVFYSTHSIFMIDEKNIDRHLIVKKEDETTKIEEAGTSDIFDEEVLYRALNYSLFEMLKEENFIFEGWRDKKLFQTGLKSKELKKPTKTLLEKFGTCHAVGIKDIPRIAAFMDLIKRVCIILSDNDEVASEAQKRYKDYHGYGHWLCYKNILNQPKELTGEDFILPEVFNRVLKKIRAEFPKLNELDLDVEEGKSNKGRMKILKDWVSSSPLTDSQTPPKDKKDLENSILNKIKEMAFENLKPSELTANYISYLEELAKKTKEIKENSN